MFPNYRPNVEASKVERSTMKHSFQLPKINLKSPKKMMAKASAAGGQDKFDAATAESSDSMNIPQHELVALFMICFHAFVEGLVVGLGTTNTNIWQLFSGKNS